MKPNERPYNPESSADREALATALEAMLAKAKFVKLPATSPGAEDVYEFVVGAKAPGCRVRVYTSIMGGAVRAKDADAIRVAGVFLREDGQARGITSDTRVFRTGDIDGIADRCLERMRNAWKALATCQRCLKCKAPMFKARSGKLACAAACWDRRPHAAAPAPRPALSPADRAAAAALRDHFDDVLAKHHPEATVEEVAAATGRSVSFMGDLEDDGLPLGEEESDDYR